ncbi:MAG: peptide chain release factor-like protein [Deltaproteobacteria bacterium]|nr:peptide chain release factor-like protein [Deltaproteobacteria bacterium]
MTISYEKQKALEKKMAELHIFEKDLEEQFVRSSGPGGQKVNRSASCVYVRHIPTGMEVKCQISRSQIENRYFARRILCDKIASKILQQKTAAEHEAYRIKKQKKRRSRKTKQKMLEAKKERAQTKKLRHKITVHSREE